MATTVMTQAVARLLLVPTFLVAAAVLVKGYSDTGDGFTAGVIAATGVLLQYVAFGYERTHELLPVRLAPAVGFVGGLLLAYLVAFIPVLLGRPILTHFPPPGAEPVHLGTLELITPVAFDVGVFLLVFGFVVGVVDYIAAQASREDA